MLQVGSDPTASSSATPSFFLKGDGGLSSYVISIDGIELGTFSSTGRAIVCIKVTRPLADGPHLLTGVELRPHPTYVVAPFAFSVDTVPPAPAVGGVDDGLPRLRRARRRDHQVPVGQLHRDGEAERARCSS